jgi:DNA-binding transcriptional MerR regulator
MRFAMKMRELEAKTGINRETIRVYFREGLLPEPSRPARNVADYGEEHVRAILAVRKLQHESRMTLPQIKATLAGEGTGRQIGATALSHLEELVASRVGVERGLVTLKSLLAQNPKARSDALALDRLGVIELARTRRGLALSVTDVGLLNIWSQMRAVGFDEDNGFGPEILDYYVEAANYVAGNEARLFLNNVEGRLSEEDAAAMLEFALPAMLNFFGIIRQRAFLRFIGDRTKKGVDVPVVKPGAA